MVGYLARIGGKIQSKKKLKKREKENKKQK
jgi:hypothetical protein